jgi:hypothetical protein
MALSTDQHAMLELMLERGQSYADLSSLLGVPADEVRSKARWALAELGGADPDRNVGLTDYLLGQADPIGRADAVRHLRDDPADRELAARLIGALGEVAPNAELPKLPGESRAAPHLRVPGRRPGPAPAPAEPRSPADAARVRMLVGLGSGAAILIVVILAIAGVFSGGGGSSTASTSSTADTGSTTTTPTDTTSTGLPPNSQTIQPIPLKGVGGGPGSGAAIFGITTSGNNQAFVDLRISSLPPPPNGDVYVAWLVIGQNRQGYPLAPLTNYPQSGSFHNTYSIPPLATPLIKNISSIDITTLGSSSATALAKEIQKSVNHPSQGKIIFPVRDQAVLRGIVPRGAAGASGSGK